MQSTKYEENPFTIVLSEEVIRVSNRQSNASLSKKTHDFLSIVVLKIVRDETRDNNYINLSYKRAKTISKVSGKGFSRLSYHKSIDQLIKSNILALTIKNNRYWINENYMKEKR